MNLVEVQTRQRGNGHGTDTSGRGVVSRVDLRSRFGGYGSQSVANEGLTIIQPGPDRAEQCRERVLLAVHPQPALWPNLFHARLLHSCVSTHADLVFYLSDSAPNTETYDSAVTVVQPQFWKMLSSWS